uniref:Mitochondrial carrier n=1 Tax=Leucosporidium scottii TaxID=5278 RepID=A0A0H5G9M6_9BASI|nr:hypothetical protein ls5930a1_00070 [Leucosporidium scottii]
MSGDLELEARPATSTVYVDPFTLVASSASAVSARLCTHPLDTIRIRIQTYPGALVPPLKQLIPKPRLQNLYAVYLTSYEASKRYFGERFLPRDVKPTLVQQLPVFVMAGMTAEFLSGAIWTPMDVMKARLQKGNEGTSATKLLKKIWREEGYKGVWRGYWLSNLVFVPYISLYWSLYESFKTHFIPGYDAYGPPPIPPPPSPSSSWTLPTTARYTLCSVTACSLAACVQSRWQTSGGKGEGVGGIVRGLWRQGGVAAFGRGLGIRVAYAIPANGISMTVYESLKRWKGI